MIVERGPHLFGMRHGVLAFVAALALGMGCSPRTPDQLRRDDCEKHPERTLLFRKGETPTRPYRVLTEVDALWFASSAGRTRILQVKACQLSADAVIDVSHASNQGRGLAIVFDDGRSPSAKVPTEAAPADATVLDSAITPPRRPRAEVSARPLATSAVRR